MIPRTGWSLLLFAVFAHGGFAGQVDSAQFPPLAQIKVDFVREVKPILAKHCYACHGPDKQENDLRWDVKSAALKGGSSGPALVPGHSAESRMIRLVAGQEKNLVMPKKGTRLTAEQVGLLRAWIDQGADWPDEAATATPADKSDWWSFKPASRPALPKVKNNKWARNPVDLFVLAKLEAGKMSPSPEADRRTLIRRLSFDLTGLPPTPEEVEKFLRDKSKRAYENLVDRLLASPRYGECWARHWLDTIHYGETHGYDKDKPRPNAWPYRDYVIRALNEDKPYSRFVEEQLAGDVLFPNEPDGVVALGFIAAGPWDFVGHVELPIQKTDGLIARYNDRDDMVMTTISTFQSLTVHCARCHDHKFDPITQKDYYSLQAVFSGVDRAERNFDSDKSVAIQRHALLQKKQPLDERHTALTNHIAQISSPEVEKLDARLGKLKAQLAAMARPADGAKSPGNGYHSAIEPKPDAVKWVQVDLGQLLPVEEVRLIPARPVDFPDTPGFGFPARFRVEISDSAEFVSATTIADHTAADFKGPGDNPVLFSANKKPARFVRVTATRLWERTSDYVFALAEMQVLANGTNAALGATVSALDSIEAGSWSKKFLVDGFDSRRKLARTLSAGNSLEKDKLESEVKSLAERRRQLVESLTDEATRTKLARVTSQLKAVNREVAALPPPKKVYAAASEFKAEGSFVSAKTPRPVHLLARGDVKRPGDLMSAAGIACVPGPNPQFDLSDTSGEAARRVALARWLTDAKNLLTRRSIVNRVWHYHFGRGLVETPNDFGHMGALPSHPELLDWLAFWFLDNGGSLKQLHRLLVTSAAYRQSSANNAEFSRLDSDNRYLWRMNRARLDAETVHDTMLLISGKLDPTMGGPAVQQFYFKDDHSPVYDYTQFDVDSQAGRRRSIYRFIVRSVPDPLMDSLDCPDASILTPKRNVTVTALQALAVLNNPFVLKQCEHLAQRVANECAGRPSDRRAAAIERAAAGDGRAPDAHVAKAGTLEKQIEQVYRLALNRRPTPAETRQLVPFAERNGMASVCRVIFNTSEFMFAD
jgi:mono/diheme cytochrome c family protein